MDWKTQASTELSSMQSTLPKLPKSTKALFRYTLHGFDRLLKSKLIRCEKCYLLVHKLCYGIHDNISDTSWLCERCQENSVAVSVITLFY